MAAKAKFGLGIKNKINKKGKRSKKHFKHVIDIAKSSMSNGSDPIKSTLNSVQLSKFTTGRQGPPGKGFMIDIDGSDIACSISPAPRHRDRQSGQIGCHKIPIVMIGVQRLNAIRIVTVTPAGGRRTSQYDYRRGDSELYNDRGMTQN
ncbi:hypothetical protein EVAR_89669_1 [Eumeta japonica]|uniref:Uncharacterized protein n=1 Tax=Eumeta variegata TaxID=151549 RepID=A0A4C1YB46_EUMVA|nr:hypothetical protein EVAR_89669_1 [Eumeta japonica]